MSKKSFRITPAAEGMRELRKLPPQTSAGRPDRLPLSAITIHEAVFQPRAMNEQHVSGLAKIIGRQGEVAPMVIWPAGEKAILLDGHHRIEAYKKAGKTDSMPVEYFEGTVDDALAKSGALNTPLKLPMTNAEKQDFAWKLETLGTYSLNDIAEKAGVGKAQVARMRAIKKQLGRKPISAMCRFQRRRFRDSSSERGAWRWDATNSAISNGRRSSRIFPISRAACPVSMTAGF